MAWEKQEGNSDFWDPTKEGEEVIGIVKEIVNGQYGKQLRIIKEDNAEILTPSHKVLQAMTNNIKKGDKVKLVFVKQDLPKIKGQNGAKIYEVFVDKQETTEEKVGA